MMIGLGRKWNSDHTRIEVEVGAWLRDPSRDGQVIECVQAGSYEPLEEFKPTPDGRIACGTSLWTDRGAWADKDAG